MSTAGQTAIDVINRSHHRREPDAILDLMADDAQYVILRNGQRIEA